MATCIDPQFIERIKTLNLNKMSSIERIKAFDEIIGSNGAEINLLYEKSLLLKNKQLDKFLDSISGVSIEKKAKIKENIAENLIRKQGVIKDNELLSIVKDALNKKYDLEIPDDVVERMFKLKNEADELSKKAIGTPDGSPEKLAWGEKIVDLSDEIAAQKEVASDIKGELKLSGQRIKNKYDEKEWLAMVGQATKELGNIVFSPAIKSVKASLDNSVLFRQGLKVLSADKGIWAKNAGKTWSMWGKVLNRESMENMSRAFKADLVTRDLYQDAIKSKLAIGVVEDFFPTSVAEKIPVAGNLFKASDEAFTMFSQGSRMDLFEKYVNLYKNSHNGMMPDKDVMKDLAKVANSTTGRGGLGSMESSSKLLNTVLFSARYQTANLNTFRHALTMTGTAGKIARKQVANHIMLIGGIMTTLSAFGDVGWNPEESTFGKFRPLGSKKWIDVTGGLGSYFSLLGKTKKAVSSKPGYGKDTGVDVIVDFMKGKLAPAPGVLRDIFEQRDYSGKKPTVASIAESLFVPITLDNPIKDVQKGDEAGEIALSSLLEFIGSSVTNPKSKSSGSYWSPLDIITNK